MILELLIFLYWSNMIIPNLNMDPSFDTQHKSIKVLMSILSSYLLLTEIPLIINRRWRWFFEVSSWANVITNFLLLANCNRTKFDEEFWQVQTWIALLIWWRFALYLRTFEKFSWMIRLIVQSLIDMSYFLIVFMIIVLSFADAFLSIQQLNALGQ